MGHFVPALNGQCSCPPMGRDLGPNPARYNGSCRPGPKLFRVVSCLGYAFFSCFGPVHQARPKCTPIAAASLMLQPAFSPSPRLARQVWALVARRPPSLTGASIAKCCPCPCISPRHLVNENQSIVSFRTTRNALLLGSLNL
jgi:hypothetical protein